jgi:hypothetical protein
MYGGNELKLLKLRFFQDKPLRIKGNAPTILLPQRDSSGTRAYNVAVVRYTVVPLASAAASYLWEGVSNNQRRWLEHYLWKEIYKK